MEGFDLDDLEQEHAKLGKLYLEFLRVPPLSMGLYVLDAGGTDPQSPHTEDEVYYVVSGEASITVGDEEQAVRTGTIVYVPANVPHRFHSIREQLRLLVFFAPAEYSLRDKSG
jgi:mannose-6-phosphate isomerase-like protein (cupin superfamily)